MEAARLRVNTPPKEEENCRRAARSAQKFTEGHRKIQKDKRTGVSSLI
jgi:hypothetical protein